MKAIYPVRAFVDNYIWLIHDESNALLVDPGDAEPALDALRSRNLTPAGILITHWHNDHIGGINRILEEHDIPVFGPVSERIPQVTTPLSDGGIAQTPLGEFEVIAVPGHTMDHIAYFHPEMRWLLCGDTLFSAGCGRMFEGTADVFQHSLARLGALPEDTQVFCAHEYTLANLAFASAVEPTNPDIIEYKAWAEKQRAADKPTIPTKILTEKRINPFLRVSESAVIEQALNQGAASTSAVDVFATLREWKNNF